MNRSIAISSVLHLFVIFLTAISLPFLKGKDDLPIGIQFIANWNEDLKLLEICKYILEKEKLAN